MMEKQVLVKGLKLLGWAEMGAALMAILSTMGGLMILGVFGIAVLALRLWSMSSLRRLRPEYNKGFLLVMGELGLSLVGSMGLITALSAGKTGNVLLTLLGLADCILIYLVVRNICTGTMEELEQVGEEEQASRGDMVRSLYLVTMSLVAIANVLTIMPLSFNLLRIVTIFANVLTAGAGVYYARFLMESSKALAQTR